mmetsp:Transcript_2318/g.15405  ORF Transcript_2318/g.15405 Transcript_2318/m.15405 type:complete len:84 (+) Transcript_2318:3253-3504(+)
MLFSSTGQAGVQSRNSQPGFVIQSALCMNISNHARAACSVLVWRSHASDVRAGVSWVAKTPVYVHLTVCDPIPLLNNPSQWSC